MGPMGAVALIEIFGFFFYIKVLEILIIVVPIENLKKKLQQKVLNPIHISIRDYPHNYQQGYLIVVLHAF